MNADAASSIRPFDSHTGDGGRLGRSSTLRNVSSSLEYNAKPLLAGRLREARSGSLLTLRYRAPLWVYVFDLVWFCALGLVKLMMLGRCGAPNP